MTKRPIPKKISLVLSDVDGTLVTDEKRLTTASVEAVWLLRAAGIRFAIASSRPPRGMQSVAGALDLDTPMAAFNGGMIAMRDGAVLASHFVPREVCQTAIETMGKAGAQIWVFNHDRWLVRDTAAAYIAREELTVGFAPTLVDDFAAYLDQVGKIVGVSEDFEFLARCEIETARCLGNKATVARSQTYYLDVTNPLANKAEALRLLAEHLCVAHSEIVAVGDGLNDIGMLQGAGFGVAMGNASAPVQSAGDFVTASNQEDGFAQAIAYILRDYAPAAGALR